MSHLAKRIKLSDRRGPRINYRAGGWFLNYCPVGQ